MEQEHRTVALDEIVGRVAPIVVLGDASRVQISGVVFNHAEAAPGSLYCCLPGERFDGHDFAARAARAGTVAFVCEHSLADVGPRAVQLVVGPGEARRAMALAACAFYRDPATSLRTVGVTGTNGKTTTTYLLRAIFERNGWPTGVVGTLDGVRTTPESPELQRALAGFRDRGFAAAALEVTSHALVQGRVDSMIFDVAVFTNLSQDHLDFHETMDAYFDAKATLFDPSRTRQAVVNADDLYGRRLIDRTSIETVTFSLAEAEELDVASSSSRFLLRGQRVELKMGGVFNVVNALGAAAAARCLGVADEVIADGLGMASGVPGRFETIESIDGVTVVVDYAHTPAALEQVLGSARAALAGTQERVRQTEARHRAARLVVVFGAGGDRDRGKRPAMGDIAGRLADIVVLTADNPRSEDPAAIADQVLAGVPAGSDCRVELDRRAAIALALSVARSGDVVVVAGKGHEAVQHFAGSSIVFDDREVVREELERQGRALPAWVRAVPARGSA